MVRLVKPILRPTVRSPRSLPDAPQGSGHLVRLVEVETGQARGQRRDLPPRAPRLQDLLGNPVCIEHDAIWRGFLARRQYHGPTDAAFAALDVTDDGSPRSCGSACSRGRAGVGGVGFRGASVQQRAAGTAAAGRSLHARPGPARSDAGSSICSCSARAPARWTNSATMRGRSRTSMPPSCWRPGMPRCISIAAPPRSMTAGRPTRSPTTMPRSGSGRTGTCRISIARWR